MNAAHPSIVRLALALLALAAAHAGAGELQERIDALLAEAAAAPTVKEADAKFTQAEATLEAADESIDVAARRSVQADIRRARGSRYAEAWRADDKQAALRDQARRVLTLALDDYRKLQKMWEDRADALEQRLGDEQAVKNREYQEACGLSSRANYAIAWTLLSYASVLPPGGERESRLQKALEKFLSFTANGYRNHPIVIDCFLGQALCLYELERYSEVPLVLKDATPQNTPPDVHRRMMFVLVKSYEANASHLNLEIAAKQYFDALPKDHKHTAVELQMALARARSLLIVMAELPERAAWARARLDAVSKFLYARGPAWRAELARVLAAHKGAGASPLSCLVKARQHFGAKKYAKAVEALQEGLKLLTADSDPAVAADLRHATAAGLWNLQRWRDAHLAAAAFLQNHPKDRRADEMCRVALQAALKARTAAPPLDDDAFFRFLAFAQRAFPDQPDLQQAPWYRAEALIGAKRFREAEAALAKVDDKSPVYRRALYGLALSACKQAEAAAARPKPDPREMARHLARTVAAVDRFAAVTTKPPPADEKQFVQAVGEIAVATGRRLLDLPEPDYAEAAAFLERIGGLPALEAETLARAAALRIEANALAGKLDAATKLMDDLLRRDAGSAYVAECFSRIADPLEREYESLHKEGKAMTAADLNRRLVVLYDFLLRYFEAHKEKTAAEAVVSLRRRLALAHLRAKSYGLAVRHYEWLEKNVPRETAGDVLRGLALAREGAKKYDDAVQTWRVLGKGLPRGSDGWLEARYHLIVCHERAGRADHARRLFTLFRLRVPKVASDPWRRKFDALERTLGDGAAAPSAPRS